MSRPAVDGGTSTAPGHRPSAPAGAPALPGVDLVGELGRGVHSVVYRGVRDGREYAVKVLRSVDDGAQVVAFRREAALLACLTHPGLVRIHEVGMAGSTPYLIMDLVAGRPLAQVLREEHPDEARVAAWGAQVAEALAAAHRAGVVHRDVKPANIMITTDGQAKLIDLGLATRAGVDLADVAVGTFRYSAPEQTGMLHRPVDGRADLYALGVVLFECVSGSVPFAAHDVGELIRSHLAAPVPDVRTVRPGASAALAAIIARLMAKDPDDRYRSGAGLAADLTTVAAGRTEAFPLGTGDAAGAGLDSGLVGRDVEYGLLGDRWRQALDGRGGLVLVHGAAGSGRTRLVRELTAAVGAAGHLVLRGARNADNTVPLGPLRAAVDRHLHDLDRAGPEVRDAARARLRIAAGDAATVLRPLSPALAALLDLSQPTDTDDEHRFATAATGFLTGLAKAAGGALLDLGDVRGWDGATRGVVDRLVPLLADAPLMVIATAPGNAGDGDGARPTDGLDADLRVELGPLPRPAVEALVTGLLGTNVVPVELLDRLVARCGGNPLAAHEWVRAVVDAGLLRPSWGRLVLDEDGLDALALPDDLADLVLHRIHGLSDGTRRLLAVAAAVGIRFEPHIIAAVCRTDAAAVHAAVTEAMAYQLVEPAAGAGLVFLHDRIRSVLLGDLDADARRRVHQRIAEEMERAGGDGGDVYAIARHYLDGEVDRTPETAYRAATAAGARAMAEYAPADAVEFLTRARSAAGRAGIEPDAAFDTLLGVAAAHIGQYVLAQTHLERALAGETDRVRRADLYRELAWVLNHRWGGERAVEMVCAGLAELGHPLPRGPAPLVLTTLLGSLAGFLVGRLPARWRLATGQRREQHRRHAEMLHTGTQCAADAANRLLLGMFILRQVYPVNRLGPGREYATTQASLSVLASGAGLKRVARRLAVRVRAAEGEHADPILAAQLQKMRSIAEDCATPMGATTGEATRRVLEEHGRLLDMGEYLTGCWEIGQIQLVRGHLAEVDAWRRRVNERMRDPSEAMGNVFAPTAAQAAALAGRHAEAAARLAEVRAFTDTLPGNLGVAAGVALAATQLAVEQGETGRAFDDAVDSFHALKATPAKLWSAHRSFWVHWAFGRLAQLAAASKEDSAARLAAAERAVAALGKAANGPVYRAYRDAARASLRQLRGDHAGALRAVGRLQERLYGLDVPLACYETARVRARALRGLGHTADARHAALAALLLAVEHGWETRARWIRAEFDVDGAAIALPSANTAGRSAGTSSHQRRLEAVHEVGLAATSVLDPAELARIALDETVRIFGAERAFLFLADDDTDTLTPYLGRDREGGELDLLSGYGASLVERVRESREALVLAGSDEGVALGSHSAVVHGLRSIMIAPLLLKGHLRGVVYLDSRAAKGVFTSDDVDILVPIANYVAQALETARAAQLELAVHAARRERDTAELLRGAMADLTSSLDPGEVAGKLIATIGNALPVDRVCLLRREETGDLVLTTGPSRPGTAGGEADGRPVWHPFDPGDDPAVLALLAGQDTVHATRERGPVPLPGVLGPDTTAWLAVPLMARGVNRGLLVVAGTERPYTEAEIEIAAALAGQGMAALDTALLFEQVQNFAARDSLTGLYNRRYFFDASGQSHESAVRDGTPFAIAMIDIDHFKRINDAHGHGVGDDVIREVAHRLAATVRKADIVCRYGGEEFAVFLPDATLDEAHTVASRLHAAIVEAPVATRIGPLPVTVSVGVAEPGEPQAGLTATLNLADEALYRAKRNGRNQVEASGAARPR